jgi:pyruvate dehydrogenase kinase 2/3/4
MERHLHADIVPPVQVIIADDPDNEDVVIRISDEGGGIPRSQMDNIWSYLFTTADPKIQERFLSMDDDDDSEKKTAVDHSNQSPIAGLGYGLPISRSYCRYFGGDLDLISMEGYGTDAFVHLKRLGDSKEPVPV